VKNRKAPILSASPVALASCLWCALGCDSFVTAPPEEPAICDFTSGTVPGARLLTRSEYRRTAQALLGETDDPTVGFPHEPEVDGFTNNTASHQANPLLVESIARAAAALAAKARDRGLALLHPCEGEDTVCADLFIEEFGRRAFRRPLEFGETMAFKTLYGRLAPSLGHEEALTAVIEAVLQSPQFLYRVEAPLGEPETGAVALGPYEMASRLSYFLWGSMPDDALLDAAEAGLLSSPAGVEMEARRLLADQRARERVLEFHAAWLGLEPLTSLSRNSAPTGMGPSLRKSIDAFIEEMFWSAGARLSDLFTSSVVYADSVLASTYGLAAPAEGLARYDLPGERAGLLTQPALLTLLANHAQSSPIRRGVFVRDRMLCAPVPSPPPTVDNSPPDPAPDLTTRQRFAVHTEDSSCATCHLAIDPIGFTFEGFDHLGRARSEELGLPVDTSGALVESGDPSIDGPLTSAVELSDRLAESSTVARCVGGKWLTFALGRPQTASDECSLAATYAKLEASGGNLVELLVALTTSPAFRVRSPHPGEGAP
jgi:hypothetical protein